MSFPRTKDQFEEIQPGDTTFAAIANRYQRALSACQIELEAIQQEENSAGKKLVGLCWHVQVNVTTATDDQGDGGDMFAAINSVGRVHRYSLRRGIGTQDVKADGVRWNLTNGGYGSANPPHAYTILPLPALGAAYPHSQPFHNGNAVFITVETQETSVGPTTTENMFYVQENGINKNVGGMRVLEGLLYFDGAGDLLPELVIMDAVPQHYTRANNHFAGDLFNLFVHMVIMDVT